MKMTAPANHQANGQDFTCINFSFSRFDLFKCRLSMAGHNRPAIGIFLVLSFLFPCVDLEAPHLARQSFMMRILVFISTALGMFVFLVLTNIAMHLFLVLSRKNEGLVGKFELQIRDDCLWEKNDLTESSHRWLGVHKIRSSPNYLFLFVTESNVLYIPKRCFPSPQALGQFKDQLAQKAGKAL